MIYNYLCVKANGGALWSKMDPAGFNANCMWVMKNARGFKKSDWINEFKLLS